MTDEERDKIGQRIQKIRDTAGITQKEFAKMLNVSYAAVQKWEQGKYVPDTGSILSMCRAFNCDADYILCVQPFPRKTVEMSAAEIGIHYDAMEYIRNLPPDQKEIFERILIDGSGLSDLLQAAASGSAAREEYNNLIQQYMDICKNENMDSEATAHNLDYIRQELEKAPLWQEKRRQSVLHTVMNMSDKFIPDLPEVPDVSLAWSSIIK